MHLLAIYSLFSFFLMKRSLADLQRDERERQEDIMLRAELEREYQNETVRHRKESRNEKFNARWASNLAEWDALGLTIATARSLTLPLPNPPGHTDSPVLVPAPAFSYLMFIGATLHLAKVGRRASALACFDALVPNAVWESMASTANSALAADQASGRITKDRRYAPTNSDEMRSLFFARLDMVTKRNNTIAGALEVRYPFSYCPPLHHCDCRMLQVGIRRNIGFMR